MKNISWRKTFANIKDKMDAKEHALDAFPESRQIHQDT